MHPLWAAALDLPDQNLIQEWVEHHVAEVDWKEGHVRDEQAQSSWDTVTLTVGH